MDTMTIDPREASRAAARRQRQLVAGLQCIREECDRKMRPGTGGLCASHYRRVQLGDDSPIADKRQASPDQRFAKYLAPVTPSGCRPWTGVKIKGYGQFRVSTALKKGAHVYAWEREHGPVPDDMVLDHLCHPIDGSCRGGQTCPHRACTEPSHLTPITRGDNARRCVPPRLR